MSQDVEVQVLSSVPFFDNNKGLELYSRPFFYLMNTDHQYLLFVMFSITNILLLYNI